MNGMNNQAMFGASPFRPEITQRQESSDGGSVAKTFVKVILTLVVIGVTIIMLPVAFCVIGMLVLSIARSMVIGIIFGGVAVIGVIVLATFLLRKISGKR